MREPGVQCRRPWDARKRTDFWTTGARAPGMSRSSVDGGPRVRWTWASGPRMFPEHGNRWQGTRDLEPWTHGSGNPRDSSGPWNAEPLGLPLWGAELWCRPLPWALVVESRHRAAGTPFGPRTHPTRCQRPFLSLRALPGSHHAEPRICEGKTGISVCSPGVGCPSWVPRPLLLQSPPSSFYPLHLFGVYFLF